MSGKGFRFKQFFVAHDKASMKVTTDSILLGSWASFDKPRRILDIGTGSGVLALMMAQRYLNSLVFGIDIDQSTVAQAEENANNSPWSSRLTMVNEDVGAFQQGEIDGIIVNPPYFPAAVFNGDHRNRARHQTSLTFADLMQHAKRLLSGTGQLACVVPASLEAAICSQAQLHGFYLQRRCRVKEHISSQDSLSLLQWSNLSEDLQDQSLVVRDGEDYSSGFKQLCSAFYLRF